jgi:hypothetical protein
MLFHTQSKVGAYGKQGEERARNKAGSRQRKRLPVGYLWKKRLPEPYLSMEEAAESMGMSL